MLIGFEVHSIQSNNCLVLEISSGNTAEEKSERIWERKELQNAISSPRHNHFSHRHREGKYTHPNYSQKCSQEQPSLEGGWILKELPLPAE